MDNVFKPVDVFQSTLSVRRATEYAWVSYDSLLISIHALREESDPTSQGSRTPSKISIHALREESDRFLFLAVPCGGISIHALREESDTIWLRNATRPTYFNPRSP